jgi:hypothetical protein
MHLRIHSPRLQPERCKLAYIEPEALARLLVAKRIRTVVGMDGPAVYAEVRAPAPARSVRSGAVVPCGVPTRASRVARPLRAACGSPSVSVLPSASAEGPAAFAEAPAHCTRPNAQAHRLWCESTRVRVRARRTAIARHAIARHAACKV